MTTREHGQHVAASGTIRAAQRTLLTIGVLIGMGVAGTIDEVLFHQLLQWHNFYVHTSAVWRIISDGLFHLFSSVLLGAGAMLLWSRRELLATLANGRGLAAGMLTGAGGFNLYDGIIQHILLNFHPVRENVENILPYDVAWNGVSMVVLLLGLLIWRGVLRNKQN